MTSEIPLFIRNRKNPEEVTNMHTLTGLWKLEVSKFVLSQLLKTPTENPELQTFLVMQPSQIIIYHGFSSLFIALQNVSKSSILQTAKGLQICSEKGFLMQRLARIQTCSMTFLQAVISQSFHVPEPSGQIYHGQKPAEVSEVTPEINSGQWTLF